MMLGTLTTDTTYNVIGSSATAKMVELQRVKRYPGFPQSTQFIIPWPATAANLKLHKSQSVRFVASAG